MRKYIVAIFLAAFTLSSCQLIQDQLDGNQAPVVGELVPDPPEGDAPLLVGFSWNIADIEGDTLSCTLIYNDGEEQRVDNCGEVTNTFHTFEKPGGYTVMLTANDGVNNAAASVAVRVLEGQSAD
jgi:hypothetical protein